MQTSLKFSRLSNLYKPLIILVSTYAIVNLVGFFVQHDFSKPDRVNNIAIIDINARKSFEFYEPVSTPAPPKIKIQSQTKILPSGETINIHLP
jgi:hypothetical protein